MMTQERIQELFEQDIELAKKRKDRSALYFLRKELQRFRSEKELQKPC